jgi:hypothetical protein
MTRLNAVAKAVRSPTQTAPFDFGLEIVEGVGKRLRVTKVEVVVPLPETTTVEVAVTVVFVVDASTTPIAISWNVLKLAPGFMANTMPDLQWIWLKNQVGSDEFTAN